MKVILTDQNFDEEVKKASLPVLVDMYADWCVSPDCHIVLDNNTQIKASEVVVGQKLLGIKDKSISSGKVSRTKVASELGHCQEVVLETGRKIKVTNNHLFYSPKGWSSSQKLKSGDKIAVCPIGDKSLTTQGNHEGELALARLVGILFTDGTLYYQSSNRYYEVSFALGQEQDVEALKKDLSMLGFNNIRVTERIQDQEISGRKFTTHTFRVKCLSKDLLKLLKEAGVPLGAKKTRDYLVPGWIQKGTAAVKREFLRGFLGGDGPKVAMSVVSRSGRSSYNHLGLNDIEFHKDPSLENSGMLLASQIRELLADFGVEIAKIFSEKDDYQRADRLNSAIIHIRFKRNFQTAFNLVNNIGYAYCRQKQNGSLLVAEFIRQILYLRYCWQQTYQKVKDLAATGHGYRYVSRVLRNNPLRTYLWIKGKAKPTIAHHGLKFDSWLQERLTDAPSGFIWEKVLVVNKIYLPRVAKITVEDTHSFIANGFLSHNCGPCKAMAPVIEELVTEMEGKAIIGKLDVDANQATASKFGIMSIPTTIIFKGGQPVKQLVGYQDKAALVKAINEVASN